MTIISKPPTEEYKKGWDRIFKKRPFWDGRKPQVSAGFGLAGIKIEGISGCPYCHEILDDKPKDYKCLCKR